MSRRGRIVELATGAEPETPVPTCPGWSVKDVVAHLSGFLDAYIRGALENATSPSWGEDHVRLRRVRSLEECLTEWEENAARAGDLFESRLGLVAMADGEPVGTLRTTTCELWRSLHGPRSAAQVRALGWDVDPTAWIDAFFLFGPADSDIDE